MADYRDPASERMENGRTMLDVMRGSKGLKGVIVAPATPGGIPINFNPHDRTKIKINVVDPNGSNVGGLTLDQMTGPAVEQALSSAQAAIPGNDINSIRSARLWFLKSWQKWKKPVYSAYRVCARKTRTTASPATGRH